MQRQILIVVEEAFLAHQLQTKNPMFGVLQPFSFRSCIVVTFKSDAIEKHAFFFANIVHRQWFSIFSWSCHLKSIVGWLPCLLRSTQFWSSIGILLNAKARDWSKIAIGLLECCRTPRVLQFSPAIAINDPDFWKGIAIRTLIFCKFFAQFEDLCVVHVFE